MKRLSCFQPAGRLFGAMICVLTALLPACAQENFQIKWTMDYTQAGTSSHANFTPQDAVLLGGPNTYALGSIYSPGGAIGVGYVVRPWPAAFSQTRCMEFTITANSFKYNITSIGFRLRRSPTGPSQFRLRSGIDNFASDLTSGTLPVADVFYSFNVPVAFNNLNNNTFSIRIYGFNASNTTLGVLWFDEITINGQVQPIVLPVDFEKLVAEKEAQSIRLRWKAPWQMLAREYVIEHSTDVQNFKEIATIPIQTGITGYTYTDENPGPGVHYYRIKLVKNVGAATFSPILAVNMTSEERVSVSPNPVMDGIIRLHGPGIEPGSIEVCRTDGQALRICPPAKQGSSIVIRTMLPLSSGLYLLSYVKHGVKEQLKVLVP